MKKFKDKTLDEMNETELKALRQLKAYRLQYKYRSLLVALRFRLRPTEKQKQMMKILKHNIEILEPLIS